MFKQRLNPIWSDMAGTALAAHANTFRQITEQAIARINQGDLARWIQAYEQLPETEQATVIKNQSAITVELDDDMELQAQVEQSLRDLHPWRKGPFQVGHTHVDAEWRSDMKWQRLLSGLPELSNRTILDVGCGNGYYMLRMAEHQPRMVLGVEPGLLQNVQFWAIEKYVRSGAAVLPLKVQDLPPGLRCFDVVFSMGILYHRKSPLEHLEQLRGLLSQSGTLMLETLVVDGDAMTCLVPGGRYAQMRNVWFLPSVDMLCLWLNKVGFKQVTVIDVSQTTTAEQRSTAWMQFHSLTEFLSADQQQTIEGHPPPKRVIISCQK